MASGLSNKVRRRKAETELFAALEHARLHYQDAANALLMAMESASASLGTADGKLALQQTKRLGGISDQALRDYQTALRACTDFVLNGGLL